MVSIDEFEKILSEITDELPEDFFVNLNGGIRLIPEAKIHPAAVSSDLYIMGEYHYDSVMGRYISIYYGSFMRTCSFLPLPALRERIAHTLKHEFRHHLESQGGQRDLEIIDDTQIQEYKNLSVSRVNPDEGRLAGSDM